MHSLTKVGHKKWDTPLWAYGILGRNVSLHSPQGNPKESRFFNQFFCQTSFWEVWVSGKRHKSFKLIYFVSLKVKKLFPLLSVLFLISIGFGQQIIQQITDTYNDGTIKSITYYKDSRNKIEKFKEVFYFKNGQKKVETPYKDGKRHGFETWWYENGQKEEEVTYRNGEKDGLGTQWYENGQKKIETPFGKLDGLVTEYYENGKKKVEGTFKDGEIDGLVTEWWENGQKKSEVTYKDKKKISSKEWNEDGSPK